MENIENRLDVLTAPVDLTRKSSKKATPISFEEQQEQLRLKLRQKVRGIFHFFECPQGSMSFVYKRFKKDPLEKFHMVDGQIYTVPLGVAMHLRETGKYPVYKYTKDQDGHVTMNTDKMVSRYGFESLEFHEIELNNELV